MTVMGIGFPVIGVVQPINAYGLFTLKPWAWMLAAVLRIITLVMNGLPLAVGILFYLFRPHVRKAFGRV